MIEFIFLCVLIITFNTYGWLMLIPFANVISIPFITYIIGKDNGWRLGYRQMDREWRRR